MNSSPPDLHAEALVAYGDPAEEIAKLARDRQAGLIVINLHGSPMLGLRMGSVTYRVLCLAPALVLALPSAAARGAGRGSHREGNVTGARVGSGLDVDFLFAHRRACFAEPGHAFLDQINRQKCSGRPGRAHRH